MSDVPQQTTEQLINVARERYSMVLDARIFVDLRGAGAPIREDGAYDPLQLAAWLTGRVLRRL